MCLVQAVADIPRHCWIFHAIALIELIFDLEKSGVYVNLKLDTFLFVPDEI